MLQEEGTGDFDTDFVDDTDKYDDGDYDDLRDDDEDNYDNDRSKVVVRQRRR
jgi:hypothetical protein